MITKYLYNDSKISREDYYDNEGGQTIIIGEVSDITSDASWLAWRYTANNLIIWTTDYKPSELRTGKITYKDKDNNIYTYKIIQRESAESSEFDIDKTELNIEYDVNSVDINIIKYLNITEIFSNYEFTQSGLTLTFPTEESKTHHIIIIAHTEDDDYIIKECVVVKAAYAKKYTIYYGCSNSDSFKLNLTGADLTTLPKTITLDCDTTDYKYCWVAIPSDATITSWKDTYGDLLEYFSISGISCVISELNNYKLYYMQDPKALAATYTIKIQSNV